MAAFRPNPIPSLIRWMLSRPAAALARLTGRSVRARLPQTTAVATSDDRRA